MASKSVTDRSKSADLVVHALRTSATSVGKKLDEKLRPHLRKGETMPDWSLVFELLARGLETRSEAARKADEAHATELSDDAGPRRRRDEAHEQTNAAVVEIKEAVSALFGDSWFGKLQLPNPIPQDPAALARAAGEFLGALDRVKLPAPRLKGIGKFDSSSWREMLESPAARLSAALQEVTRETREAEVTYKEKSRAVAAHDAFFGLAAGLSVSLLRLAGEDELAARLRPSGRRPGTVVAEEDESAPDPAPNP